MEWHSHNGQYKVTQKSTGAYVKVFFDPENPFRWVMAGFTKNGRKPILIRASPRLDYIHEGIAKFFVRQQFFLLKRQQRQLNRAQAEMMVEDFLKRRAETKGAKP